MRKEAMRGFTVGFVVCALLVGMIGTAIATGNLTTLENVRVGGIRIVVDGEDLHPTDANGNTVEPLIYNGTTYLPVRAIAEGLGKAVYWDGPNYTVYLGEMGGTLEYPSVLMIDMVSIEETPRSTTRLVDNYGNRYDSAIINNHGYNGSAGPLTYEYLLNMQYSRFKGTIYVPEGETSDRSSYLTIKADGHIIYTSPEMTKTSSPVKVDVNITGYNDVEIEWSNNSGYKNISGLNCCLANAGFYQ